ncbi:hypothetical protein K1719_001921 [Acacia pycnantha]|nr:hypothetical protein K1719_001921 [Acacia pycnantha]
MGSFASKTMNSPRVADQHEEEQKQTARPGSIATNWRELSGQNYWKDLLDPLDINLRREEGHSSRLEGTNRAMEWIKDVQFLLDDAPYIFGDDSDCKVHRGFYSVYTSTNSSSQSNITKTSARTQVLTEIRRLVNKYKDEEISITVTGHSLGAALATLNAVDIVASKCNIREDESQKACPVTAIVFASPRVGDSDFEEFSSCLKDLRILRIHNKKDIVPRHPFLGYKEVGEELEIDTQESSFLKQPGDMKSWHNLEVYLHGVAGTQGSKGGFNLEVKRDIALVNKGMDALKDEYHIPEAWRIDQNKGLVQQPDGTWKMQEPESECDDDDF